MPRSIWIVNFKRYNPPSKALSLAKREGEPLDWVRLTTNWYDDEAVISLPPEERMIWPALVARAGEGKPHGHIRATPEELAMKFRISSEALAHALDHFWRKGMIRFTAPRATDGMADE